MTRIHVLGAAGSGTSTLGASLAARLDLPHVEADDVFWLPTEPPFTTRRPLAARRKLLRQRCPIDGHWVFSGSALRWGTPIERSYDLIVYLWLDPARRMARLGRREAERYGGRIQPGGDMATSSAQFLAWAAAYDTAGPEQRSRVSHEQWLADQTAPIVRLDSTAPVDDLVDAVFAVL